MDIELAKSQSIFRKALKRAGRHAGIDIATGTTTIRTYSLSDIKVQSGNFAQNSENYTTIVLHMQSELDTPRIPYKYKSCSYPDDFEVHIHLKNLEHDDCSSSGTISDSKECMWFEK